MSLPTSVNPSLLFVLVFNACLVAACFSSDSSSNPGNAAGSEDSGFTDQDIASTMESTDLLDDAAIAVVVNPSPDTVESSPNPAPDPLGASQPDIDTDAGVTVTEESVSGPVGPDIARV